MRRTLRIAVATAGVLVLWHGTSFAALDKCQKRIQNVAKGLQKDMYSGIQKCADAIRKETVKGAVTGGTDCGPGRACLPTAAAACEKEFGKIYDALNLAVNKSKVEKFRIALEKARQPNGAGVRECEDADLAIFTGMGHLLSGTPPPTNPAGAALALAPPLGTLCDHDADGKIDSNCAGRWTTDFLIYSIESLSLKQAIQQTPDLLAIIKEAIDAGSVNVGKKTTSCAPLDIGEDATQAYRPNLCRFGVQCKTAVCNIDAAGTCSGPGPEVCQTDGSVTCPGSETCNPTNSKVTLDAPALAGLLGGALDIPIYGSLTTEVCRAGATAGICKTCPGGAATCPCQEDSDCTGSNDGPCSFFPGQGLGASTDTTPNTIYLMNTAQNGISAPEPPVGGLIGTLLTAACVEIVQSEGWCACGAGSTGIRHSAIVCQDKDATDTAGTLDECGALQSAAEDDEFFASQQNGPLTVQPSGSSAVGDCVDMVTLQFKLITDTDDRGPDNISCTADDFVAPTATFTIPLTTGSATARIYDVPSELGACSTTTDQVCVVDADCPGVETCTGGNTPIVEAVYDLGPVTGSKPGTNQCARYSAGDLSQLSLVSAATAVNLPIDLGGGELPVDGLLNFKLSCK